ncbi:flavodoxin domain-containing protein [Paracoccus salsus]|uniref:flavodoxin domain-containing protein n=1 Tax=Paracoccus salsus TaxID=2911061 RepID=UPI001F410372|nr:flavodoxin domain-containing protein [Paracoccus salsus]MCF3975109.1 protoporphyrinogen oxidase [Paracoccus salsus]
MEIVVLFATCEGQTRRIADFIAEQVRRIGHDVTLVDASEAAELSLAKAERVILAAPVHERRHPPAFEAMLAASRDRLNKCPTLMVSVSLKAAFPEGLEEAQDYLIEMEMRTGFAPTQEVLAAGAVRTRSYDYFQNQIVRHAVLQGQDIELTDGVREFTDWDALAGKVVSFLES